MRLLPLIIAQPKVGLSTHTTTGDPYEPPVVLSPVTKPENFILTQSEGEVQSPKTSGKRTSIRE